MKTLPRTLFFLAAFALLQIQTIHGAESSKGHSTPAVDAAGQMLPRVACLGDSLTWGFGIREKGDDHSYPAQLQGMLGNKTTVGNFGQNGATVPSYIKSNLEQAMRFNPDVVVIMLGANDASTNNGRTKDAYIPGYKKIIAQLRSLPTHPHIYICYPTPAFAANVFDIQEEAILQEIRMLEKMAAEMKVDVIDLHTALKGHSDLFPDHVHPNSDGAAIIAKAVYKALAGKDFAGTIPHA